jgi:2-phospho-L-lactate guanylyltransferase (CobY/MobA/RfbA family)
VYWDVSKLGDIMVEEERRIIIKIMLTTISNSLKNDIDDLEAIRRALYILKTTDPARLDSAISYLREAVDRLSEVLEEV